MSAIPEDIQKAADLAYDRIIDCEPFSSFSAHVIAEALLAERTSTRNATLEESAQIAESFADGADVAALHTVDDITVAEHRAVERIANRIAQAIRGENESRLLPD